MENQNDIRSWIIAGVVLVALLVAYFYMTSVPVQPVGLDTSTTTAIATSTEAATTTNIQIPTKNTGSYTTTVLPLDVASKPQVPKHASPLSCISTLTTEQCDALKVRLAVVVGKIDKNSTDFASWVDLGTIRRQAGDYVGAVDAWNHVTKMYPTNVIAFNNLGSFYAYTTKDYVKAEASYLGAIRADAANPAAYRELFTIYSATAYQPTPSSAEDILKKGIANSPTAIDLQVMLAQYYAANNRVPEARTVYTGAIEAAHAQNLHEYAAQIQAEAVSL